MNFISRKLKAWHLRRRIANHESEMTDVIEYLDRADASASPNYNVSLALRLSELNEMIRHDRRELQRIGE